MKCVTYASHIIHGVRRYMYKHRLFILHSELMDVHISSSYAACFGDVTTTYNANCYPAITCIYIYVAPAGYASTNTRTC